ncbi:MAG TPA: thiamine pyrophosphate-dependent dehydrogenase E1 component subunit alpha [Candidatus Polarisedimenticolia bacterium]|nr:thiamine pyrophosphate-dependent dehydrogenase E1 component subunit alpha [Candidatus Polarisedimenticolia bacterium]
MPRAKRSTTRRTGSRPSRPPGLSTDRLREIYYFLKMNRLIEERLSALYRQGKVQGGLYSSRGQEAISVGSAYALGPQDILAPMIRNLGAMLVKGVRPLELFLQYLQREGSPCKGRDTSLHFGGIERGLVPPISHLGTLVPVMAGVALAARRRGKPVVALTYVGDGASSTGDFHEGLGIASVRRLPMVLILENNRWAYSTPVSRQSLLTDLADRARGYGIPRGVVDGNDVLAVCTATSSAIALARRGGGPVLLECKTMRMRGHSEHDDAWYVPEEEKRYWERRDPISLYEKRLIARGSVTQADLQRIEKRCLEEIERDLETALSAPFPAPESCIEDVYASGSDEAHVHEETEGELKVLDGGRRR